MSDGQRNRNRTRRSRLPANRQSLCDAAWDAIQQQIEDSEERTGMTMGQVVGGRSGGKVRVRVDDEDEDRVIGFPSAQGTNYQPGDRVALGRSRTGEYLLLGNLAPRDAAVGRSQIYNNAVGTNEIEAGTVTKPLLEQGLRDQVNDAVSSKSLSNTLSGYVKSGALDNYAKTNALDKLSTATSAALNAMNRRIKKLEDKDKKKKNANNPPAGS